MGRLGSFARPPGARAHQVSNYLRVAALAAGLALGTGVSASGQTLELASADTAPASIETIQPRTGGVTGLAIPRFVSLKSDKVNARRGPSLSHRVDWVFVRRGLPVEVIAEHGNWRKVRDHDGAAGWVHHSLIRGARSVIVTAPEAWLLEDPSDAAETVARAERGVLAWIEECDANWCEIEAQGHEGWARKSGLWGVRAGEVID